MIYYWAMNEKGEIIKYYTKDKRDEYLADNPKRRMLTQKEIKIAWSRRNSRKRQEAKIYSL